MHKLTQTIIAVITATTITANAAETTLYKKTNLHLESTGTYKATSLKVNISETKFHENMGFNLKFKLKVKTENNDSAFYIHLGFGFPGDMTTGKMPLDHFTAYDPIPLTLVIYPKKKIAELRKNRVLISKNTFTANTDDYINVLLNIKSAGMGIGVPAYAGLQINGKKVTEGHFYWYIPEHRWKAGTPRSWPVLGVTGKSTCMVKDLSISALPNNDQIRPPLTIGTLKPFWKYQPVLGPYLTAGLGIQQYSEWDFYQDTDFPYPRKKGKSGDVVFTEGINVVRLLGGIDDREDKTKRDLDLAYRDMRGNIKYRWDLLRKKLDLYRNASDYNYTFVLDNIPYCFRKKPIYGPFGQVGGPDRQKEWADFVTALCLELKTIFGSAKAKSFRFRLLTESRLYVKGKDCKVVHSPKEDYLELYETTANAIKKALPEAKFGPYNQSGLSVGGLFFRESDSVSHSDVAQFTEEKKLPFDFMSASKYYTTQADPDDYAFSYMNCFKNLKHDYPHLASAPLEIHEWGLNFFESKKDTSKVKSNEPGAFGTSLIAHKVIRLGEQGLDRLYHWELLEKIRKGSKLHYYLTGHGYLYHLMEPMFGGKSWVYRPQNQASPQGTKYLCLGSAKKNITYLLFTAHNTDMEKQEKETLRYLIPKSHLQHGVSKVRYTTLNRKTDPYTVIKSDLKKAGYLKQGYIDEPLNTSRMRDMINSKEAEPFLSDRFPAYIDLWKKNMTLKPSPWKLESKGNYYEIEIDLTPPETLILVAE